jgi:tetratricopeptide (TPR) repeat protein
MKPFKCAVTGIILVSLGACAGKGSVTSVPGAASVEAGLAEARFAEAESLYRRGCYVPLKKAFGIYRGLYAKPAFRERAALPFLRTCLVLSTREKDVGILDRDRTCLNTAEEIVRANKRLGAYRTWIEMAALIAPPARGVQTDIDPKVEWAKTLQKLLDARDSLKVKATTDELLTFLFMGWNCSTVPLEKNPEPAAALLAIFPDSILLKYQAAVCGQMPDRQALEALAVAEPEFYEARLHLGEINIRDGVVLAAEKELLKAFEGIPDSPQVLILLASVYYAVEEFDKGLEFYDKTLAASPEYRDALLGKAVCLASLRRYEESIAVLERIIALGYWLLGESNYWLAWNKHELGRNAEALANIEEAKMRLPMNSEVFSLAGTLAWETDDVGRAEKNFRESLQYNGSSTESLFGLGNVDAKYGKWAESADFYEKASQVMDGTIADTKAKMAEIAASSLSEERKARLIKRNEQKYQGLLYSRATAYFAAATSRGNAGDAAGARRLAILASEHPSYKTKTDDLLKKLAGRRP